MLFLRAVLLLSALVWAGAGCAKAQARTEPVPPAELVPPPPPPRVVEQYPDEPQPIVTTGTSEATIATPPLATTPKPLTPKPEATTKVEPAQPEPQRPPTPPPAVTLKPTPGSQSSTEASIRGLIGRAMRDLNRVNYGSLTGDGKAQYDTARRFVEQSEDALKNGNLVFAGKLADKAATMAAVLLR